MKIVKIIGISALALMTIFNPISASASHHSSDTIIFDSNFWKGDNYKQPKYQKKIKKLKEYQSKNSSSSKKSKSKSSSKKSTKKNTKIKVDTKKNRIYLYEKVNGEWNLVKSEKCCTGKDGATSKGTFKAGSKEKSFTKNGFNYNYVTYFNGNIAIHSTPYDGEKYNNHSLGHSRSHGCVRVKPETAKWIYENIEKGTTIEVE